MARCGDAKGLIDTRANAYVVLLRGSFDDSASALENARLEVLRRDATRRMCPRGSRPHARWTSERHPRDRYRSIPDRSPKLEILNARNRRFRFGHVLPIIDPMASTSNGLLERRSPRARPEQIRSSSAVNEKGPSNAILSMRNCPSLAFPRLMDIYFWILKALSPLPPHCRSRSHTWQRGPPPTYYANEENIKINDIQSEKMIRFELSQGLAGKCSSRGLL